MSPDHGKMLILKLKVRKCQKKITEQMLIFEFKSGQVKEQMLSLGLEVRKYHVITEQMLMFGVRSKEKSLDLGTNVNVWG
jgi:hypothetical protein